MLIRLAITVFSLLIVYWGLLYVYQDRIMFAAWGWPVPTWLKPPENTVVMKRAIDAGEVEAWFVPIPDASPDSPAPLVIYFHGNGETIDTQWFIIDMYHELGISVLLVEYRGYGRSAGRPSQTTVVDDAVYFYDQIVRRDDVDTSRIIFHGRSLGAAVALALSEHRKPVAIISESTFTNTAAMARRFMAPAWLVTSPFRNDKVLESIEVPVLLFHGSKDTVVPVTHGRALHKLTPGSVYHEYPCDHNDFPGTNEGQYRQAVAAFTGDHLSNPRVDPVLTD